MRRLIPALCMFAISGPAAGSAGAQDRITGRLFATRSEVIARNGMAATSQPLATQVALDILKKGGSAVDAAISANATLGLVEPTGSGIGGDLFAIVWDSKTRKLHGINGSGRSPRSLTLEHLRTLGFDKMPSLGPLPVTVPGVVHAWFELHARFGKLPIKDVLAPAIRYAEEGFPVTELIAHYWGRSEQLFAAFDNYNEVFSIAGRAPRKGEVFRNPYLALTYRRIANEGRDVFYRGDIARAIDAFMKRHEGFLSCDDLAEHRSEWVDPVSANYRGYDVWELPPNGQGIAVLQILNILEGFDLEAMGFGSEACIHHFVEAKKLAFEDRARHYADPAFATIPVARLISEDYAAERRALIQERAARKVSAGEIPVGTDTVYLTTADREGNMVSLIQSNYRGMGSGMVPDGLGFMLQDRGELFDLAEGKPNSYAPGKRPFHTIIPGFITKDGEPFLSFGVMGGATQPQVQAQIVINLVDFGMNLQEAGDAPRILHSGSSEPTGETMNDGGTVSLESGFDYEVLRSLARRGHKITVTIGDFGGYQAIRWDPVERVYYGASESRKDGQAAGY